MAREDSAEARARAEARFQAAIKKEQATDEAVAEHRKEEEAVLSRTAKLNKLRLANEAADPDGTPPVRRRRTGRLLRGSKQQDTSEPEGHREGQDDVAVAARSWKRISGLSRRVPTGNAFELRLHCVWVLDRRPAGQLAGVQRR
jgi:hypothetical protein